MGFLGVVSPEAYGGLGAGYLELCVGGGRTGPRAGATPFSSSVFLATEFLLLAGSEAQKQAWLPKLAAGEAIGTFAFVEGNGPVTPKSIRTAVANGAVTGTKAPVADGDIADFAIVAARTGSGNDERSISLFVVDLNVAGVAREAVETIDPTRSHARITFSAAPPSRWALRAKAGA